MQQPASEIEESRAEAQRNIGRDFVYQLLRQLHQRGGTDLHLIAGAAPALRIQERLHRVGKPLQSDQCNWLAECLLTEEQSAEFHQARQLNFAISLPGIARFRVNAYFQRGSVGMAMRCIPSNIPKFSDLSLPESLCPLILAERGLLLVCGAAGQGKSTTLAALIDYRNQNHDGHILTIEDPVEFTYRHGRSLVSQREVGTDTNSFHEALHSALRQSPDVIVIGEVRDQQTMRMALEAADTGHLCIASIHAPNAAQAVDRILGLFLSEARTQVMQDLAQNLNGVISQRLVPSVNGELCPVVELLLNTPAVASAIRQGRTEEIRDHMQKSRERGMLTFDDGLFDLAAAGRINEETALTYADVVSDLRLRLRLARSGGSLVAPSGGFA